MNSYIIRIYRRHENDRVTGIVEDIEAQIESGFSDRDELWKILLKPRKRTADSKERPGRRR